LEMNKKGVINIRNKRCALYRGKSSYMS